jgi:tRNA (guanine37-N1)-methyltransferase
MQFGVVTVLPELLGGLGAGGVTGRAIDSGRVGVSTFNPREYTTDRHRTVDDRPYGGGPGMVMMVEPLRAAIGAARADLPGAPVVYLTPQGPVLRQRQLEHWALGPGLILLCGRYEGVDERLIGLEVDEELSLGDFVLSGGEVAAMAVIDGVARLLPGVLGCENSAAQDSFADGLLDYPHYTRPERVDGLDAPEVLLSGHHNNIARWRLKQALGRTFERRPELLQERGVNEQERVLLDEYLAERTQRGTTRHTTDDRKN